MTRGALQDKTAAAGVPPLTLELVLVLVGSLLLPDQDLGGHVQADHARVGHQEEHDELLAHHPQGLVLPAVDGGWTEEQKGNKGGGGG